MQRIEDQGDSAPIGPHGATLTLVEDAEEPRNRLYEIADPQKEDGVTLTGEELDDIPGIWETERYRGEA